MIVATSDFNMGAMENKGLNIFNTKFVLASPPPPPMWTSATSEAVVAHEYFHNWTGNRVTCRDWFQLSLKEGLTVFRDQEFSMDMAGEFVARAVKRIEDVRVLRTASFPKMPAPWPTRCAPTATWKSTTSHRHHLRKGCRGGAHEHNRWPPTARPTIAAPVFARGMKLYFERHDGQAVTCDDFARLHRRNQPAQPSWPAACSSSNAGMPGRYTARGGARPLRRGIGHLPSRFPDLPRHARPPKGRDEPFVIPVAMACLVPGRSAPCP